MYGKWFGSRSVGEMSYTFEVCDHTEVHVTDGYYVAQGKARLLSPQRLYNKQMALKCNTRVMKTKSLFKLMGCLQWSFRITSLVASL